jgi:DNA-binding MarR family transcriptional regulator
MDQTIKWEQAKAIASLLPAIMHQLFTLEDDLAAELPLGQLRLCAILCDGPRPMSVLSRELGVSLSAMTQIADRLERAKLVSRVTVGSDRRVRCLQLTQQGEKMMKRREEHRIHRVLAVLNHISPSARKEILAGLDTLMTASAANRPEKGPNGKGLSAYALAPRNC